DDLRRLGVRKLGLFGSASRREATEASDLDFLVGSTERPSTAIWRPRRSWSSSSADPSTWSSPMPSSPGSARGSCPRLSMPRDYKVSLEDILNVGLKVAWRRPLLRLAASDTLSS